MSTADLTKESLVKPRDSFPVHQGRRTTSKFRKVYSWLGFSKGYNVPLFVILAGAMTGFCLAKIAALDVSGYWTTVAAPGEWYWYRHGHYRVGLTLHLATVVPGGLLMVLQFVPAIRHRFILFHRINGYVVIILVLLGNAGALMIARHAFGGDLATQGAVGVLAIATTTGVCLAYYNIKRLQVEQHRAWMLRTMVYMGTIITTRLIQITATKIVTLIGSYHDLMTCGELNFIINNTTLLGATYPVCVKNSTSTRENLATVVPVHVKYGASIQETGAALRVTFGMALWMSMFLHALGLELYLALTPREAQRLRQVSYRKQLEAGFKNPGSAGLVVERIGDSELWSRESGSSDEHGKREEYTISTSAAL